MRKYVFVFYSFFLLLMLTVSLVQPCEADIIFLENGMEIEGTITEKTDDYILLSSGVGVDVKYYLDEIRSINGQAAFDQSDSLSTQYSPEPIQIPLGTQQDPVFQRMPTNQDETMRDVPANSYPEQTQGDFRLRTERLGTTVRFHENSPRPKSFNEVIELPGIHTEQVSLSKTQKGVFGGLVILLIIGWFVFTTPLYIISNKLGKGFPFMAFLPIANLFLMCDLAKKSYFFFVLMIIPLVNIIASIFIWMGIAENCKKPEWLGVLILVPFVNIFLPWYLALTCEEFQPEMPKF